MRKGFTVAASDVGGAFVKDLAVELGKSASTIAAYLRKHLPTTLVKRKNANNRLANFCTADGVAGLRAHYKPTYASETSELVQELERLRDENKRLRAILGADEHDAIDAIEANIDAICDSCEEQINESKETLARMPAAFEKAQRVIDGLNRLTTNAWRQTNDIRKQDAKNYRRTSESKQRTRGEKQSMGESSSRHLELV